MFEYEVMGYASGLVVEYILAYSLIDRWRKICGTRHKLWIE